MVKINAKLVPIKAHYFFFMAAMGPILPQLAVLGKELGIGADVMGYITAVLPVLYVIAKPAFGYLADYFTTLRKGIFLVLIIAMTLCYAGFYFIPESDLLPRNSTATSLTTPSTLLSNSTIETHNLSQDDPQATNHTETSNGFQPNLLTSSTFWVFVVLMCLGTIGFNVTNSISDAICFDVLGESQEMKYGAQRVWGTIGFGVTALVSGIAVYYTNSSFTPAIIIMLIFSGFDLLAVSKLKLPSFGTSETLLSDVYELVTQKSIAMFLIFATLAGIIDSFIIYYLFWYLEDVAKTTGYEGQIKLIEGIVVAAECLCGEIPMFLYSGKILKKIGFVHCLTLCFFTYAIRLGLVSLIPNPWWLVPIEMVMQGCTYALCYTCIVAYAAAIAPQGTSATVQGLVAGVDDGLGYAIGSLIGGLAYKEFGGKASFQMFAALSLVTGIAHMILRPAAKYGYEQPVNQIQAEEKV